MEIGIEIGIWWVLVVVEWWPVSGFGSCCGFLGGSCYGCRGMVVRLVFGGSWWWWHGGEAGVCCDWCLDWGCDLIFSVRDERDIFCAWVMGLQL